jgi:hypothetical protein
MPRSEGLAGGAAPTEYPAVRGDIARCINATSLTKCQIIAAHWPVDLPFAPGVQSWS